jgi:arylsulfatase A-like enzyme
MLNLLALGSLLLSFQAQAAQRPNVVVILADDLGYGDLGCYGGALPTPNIDRLASEGARFTQAYAAAPVCTPSRAGLFTGRYPALFGVQANTGTNKIARKRSNGAPGEVVMLPERLDSLGYWSGLIGKWHLGVKEGMEPVDQGFDEFFGFLGASHRYLPVTAGDTRMLRGKETEAEYEKEFLTDAFARESEAFLAKNRAKPFFLTVALSAPHNPYEANETLLQRFPNLTGQPQAYAALVSSMDDAVGRILAALEKEGLAANTLVVFASDNGAMLGESPGSNAPLFQGKAFLFEGGIRVPMIARWPGQVNGGQTITTPVSLLDVSATTLAVAGADEKTLAELDGLDLRPLLAGKTPPERTFLWRMGPSSAIRKGDWKLVASNKSRWLFDLATDPGEKADLASSQPERVAELERELAAWSTGCPEMLWRNEKAEAPFTVHNKSYWVEY